MLLVEFNHCEISLIINLQFPYLAENNLNFQTFSFPYVPAMHSSTVAQLGSHLLVSHGKLTVPYSASSTTRRQRQGVRKCATVVYRSEIKGATRSI